MIETKNLKYHLIVMSILDFVHQTEMQPKWISIMEWYNKYLYIIQSKQKIIYKNYNKCKKTK